MDVQMPVMDGVTATKLLRAAEVQTGRRRTPVIALTANAMTHHREEYLAAGMDALVSKPLDIASLVQAMDAVLIDQPATVDVGCVASAAADGF